MAFVFYKDIKSLKIIQFGTEGNWVWRSGVQKVGFTPWLIWHAQPTYQRNISFKTVSWVAPMLRACNKTCFWAPDNPLWVSCHERIVGRVDERLSKTMRKDHVDA
eukprot:1158256-Pelagomonas_calceolata.AAC.11